MTKIIRKKAIFALAAAAVMAAATGTSLMVANKIKADAAIEDIHSATVGTLGELENNYQNLVMPVDRITERVASSTQGNNPTGTYGIEKMFDNNLGTKWEAVWDNTLPEKTFTFTFAQEETITGFYEVTRRDNNINGTMSWYKVYTSETGEDESWTEVISDGTMPYQLGTWSTVFSEPITAKYLRISTDADAITEFRFYYEPTSASDLAVLKTEIDKMYPFVTSGEAFNVYDEDTYQQIVTDMTAAEAMPETSAEEITANPAKELVVGGEVDANAHTLSIQPVLNIQRETIACQRLILFHQHVCAHDFYACRKRKLVSDLVGNIGIQ